jgi:hypothetical protein
MRACPRSSTEAARSLVALRYYLRFIEQASGQEAKLEGGDRGRLTARRTMAEALFQIAEPGESRAKHACRTRAVGIDLGTTNSLVAIVDAGRPAALADEQGSAMVPSVVHYCRRRPRRRRRGRARSAGRRLPRDTIASVKRFMGRGRHDAEATRKLTPYRFASADGGGASDEHRTKASFASPSRAAGRSRRWRCRPRSCACCARAPRRRWRDRCRAP